MASNIGSNASFATANMKPDAGEVIDALWGKNLADNTANVYFRETYLPGVELNSGGNRFYLYAFTKTSAHNAIRFKSRGQGSNGTITESYELANTQNGPTILSGTWTHGRGTHLIWNHDADISSLGNGTQYFFFHDTQHLSVPVEGCWASLIHGTGFVYV